VLARSQASGDVPDVVESLLDAGAPIDAREGDSLATPLHGALEARHLRVAAALLRRGADVALGNSTLGVESSALHDAAQRNDLEIVQLLVGARADVDQPGRAGMRPLHLVARTGERGALSAARCARAARPSHACDRARTCPFLTGTVETARYLLDAGARADLADARGKLPSDYAAANPRQAHVLELLRDAAGEASQQE
jgi:ankyrin repeat protein